MPDIPWEDAFEECLTAHSAETRQLIRQVLPRIPLADLQVLVHQAFAPLVVHLNKITVIIAINRYASKLERDPDLVSYERQIQFVNDAHDAAINTAQNPGQFNLNPAWFTKEGCFMLLTTLTNHWVKATGIEATFPDVWLIIANHTPKTNSGPQGEVRARNTSSQEQTPTDQIGPRQSMGPTLASGNKNCCPPNNTTYMVWAHGYRGSPCLIAAPSAVDIEDKIIEILTKLASTTQTDQTGYQLVVLEGECKLVQITKMVSVSDRVRDNDSVSNFYFMIGYVSNLYDCMPTDTDYRKFIREKMLIARISQTPLSIDNL